MRQQRKWTSKEEEILKKTYRKLPVKQIIKRLNRNHRSIKMKAFYLGLTGPRGHINYFWSILKEHPQKKFDPTDHKGWFISGFFAGEGTFTTANGKNNRKHYRIAIGLCIDDIKILREIKQFFGCGNIYHYKKRKEHWKDEVIWKVGSQIDIYSRILPFFDTFIMANTHKQKQYEAWKKAFIDSI